MQQTAVDGFSLANGTSRELGEALYLRATFGITLEKITSRITARQECVNFPMSRQQREVEMSANQNTQFDPGR